ncbi:MAG: TlpA disulfide reductase family protein [Longimicrobiales bacterium]|nr:TlpA disulfide reductase family protein [Longimicrobiales bacterium]
MIHFPSVVRAPVASPAAAGPVLLALLLGTFAGPRTLAAQGMDVSLPLGSPAPEVALEDLDGKAVRLGDVLGSGPALIEFWATWCENCEALQPQLDEIHIRFGDRLQVVAIAVAVAQSQRRVKRHLEDHDPGYPYLWDGDGAAVRAYQAATTSIVVLLDADGKVAYTGVGAGQDLVGEVERLLSGS